MGETRKYRSKTILPLILALLSCGIMLVSSFILPFLEGTEEYKELVDAGTAVVGETFLEGTSLSAEDTKELTIFELCKTGFESAGSESGDKGGMIVGIVTAILLAAPILLLLIAILRLPILCLILLFIPAGAYGIMSAALQDASKDYVFGPGHILYAVGLGLLFISAIWMIVGKSKDKRRRRELERAAASAGRRKDPPLQPAQQVKPAASEEFSPGTRGQFSTKPFLYALHHSMPGMTDYAFYHPSGDPFSRLIISSPTAARAHADFLGTEFEADLDDSKERGKIIQTQRDQTTGYLVSATSCGYLLQCGGRLIQTFSKTDEFDYRIEDGEGNPLLISIPVSAEELPELHRMLPERIDSEIMKLSINEEADAALLLFIMAVL